MKGSPREYTHTRMGVHEDILLRKGELKRDPELGREDSPYRRDAVYLK
jgi:hypothetical protein